MNIDYSRTLKAYLSYEGKMEHLTRVVHEYVLSDLYLDRPGKAKQILKGIGKIAAVNDELLLQSFVGKLRYKLPSLHLEGKLSSFERERAKLIAAGIVTSVLLDSGAYDLREEVKTITVNDQKKFKKFLYIQLGGVPVRDYYKGIHLESGVVNQTSVGSWSLTKEQCYFLSDVASVPYKIWDGCTEELLMMGYSLKVDWNARKDSNGRKLSEDPICKRNRYRVYADKIVNNVKRFPKFYLSMKYDDRYRVYYDAAILEGIRPHGKLWETLMIDSAEPFTLTEQDCEVLKHIIYVNLHGRATIETANKRFGAIDAKTASILDPFAARDEKEFGVTILLNKSALALDDYEHGRPSTFMFGYDFTNSGLMMAGLSFHSKKMMKAANLGNHKTVYDSHTEFGSAFGLNLPRKEVKKLHTALMHGGTNKSLLDQIVQYLPEGTYTERFVTDATEKAYGDCVRNVTAIADWGTIAVGNRQSILRWTMPDGFKACSRAHMVGVPVRCYAASARHKEGYTAYTVVSNMPLVEDRNGFPIYDKNTELDGVPYPVKVKKRGLFANLTHSIDAYVLRCVVKKLIANKRPFLLKHDDYIVPPGAQSIVKRAAQEVFDTLYKTNMYQKALEEIVEHSPYGLMLPQLHTGDAKNTASTSANFLMP